MRTLAILAPILLLATSTFAESPAGDPVVATPETRSAEELVQSTLLQPLSKKEDERSRFTRARLPPQARRLRILDSTPRLDPDGHAFVRFAVDARHGRRTDAPWKFATITGCAYLDRREVFIAKGGEYRPAKFLLGKYAKAAGGDTCRDASGTRAQVTQAQAAPGA